VKVKRALKLIGALLLAAVLLAFPYGPAFPWSPVHPGYETMHFDRADILYPSGTTPDTAYQDLDNLIAEAERFHQLKAPHRLTVIACRDWNDFRRFMPNIGGTGVAAVTLETGTVIYVTPKVREKNLDTREFLLHELSHAVIHQNTPILNRPRMNKHGWFFEGIAVACGKQKAYDTPEQFLAKSKHIDLTKVIGPTLDELPQPPDMRFNYVAWRSFLAFLIETQSRDKFQQLLTSFIADPDAIKDSFARIYGERLPDAVRRFQTSVSF
jgi:hypothetical protein